MAIHEHASYTQNGNVISVIASSHRAAMNALREEFDLNQLFVKGAASIEDQQYKARFIVGDKA